VISVPVRRVLIIEDCVEDALLLGLAFEDHAPEVHVEAVSDAESGLICCQSSEPPQLVVLRVQVPLPLRVVCWSSHAHPAEVQAVLEHGAVAYLEKPREITGFGRLVHTLLTL
jgi:CheY-like chemotaxis protein